MNLFEIFGDIAIRNENALASLDETSAAAKTTADSMNSNFTEFGRGLSAVGSGFQRVGTSLTNHITKPALFAGSAALGLVGALGFKRMTGIDQASKRMQALGVSTKNVKSITNDLVKVIDKTAFSLDDAMTVASTAMAAGIKQGTDLNSYIKEVGDTASIAGMSMSEMGDMFNKVAASGKLTGDVLNSFQQSGIPLIAWLSKSTGKTQAEISDMVSSGQIDLATFRQAVEENIGGAADIMGQSIPSKLTNVKTAIAKIGASFFGTTDDANSFASTLGLILDKIYNKLTSTFGKAESVGKTAGQVLKGAFEYFTKGSTDLDKMNPSARKVFTTLQPLLTIIKGLATAFNSLSPKMKAVFIGGLLAIGPLLTGFGKLLSTAGFLITNFAQIQQTAAALKGGLAAFGGPIALIVAGVVALVAAFIHLWKTSETFRNAIKTVFGALVSALKPLITSIMTDLKTLWNQVLKPICDVVAKILGPVFVAAFAVIGAVITAVVAKVAAVIHVITKIATTIASVFQKVHAVLTVVFVVIYTVISAAVNKIKAFVLAGFNVIKTYIINPIKAVLAPVRAAFNTLKNHIVNPLNQAKAKVKGIIDAIKGFFRFKISFPHIPLPHFAISPAGWKISDLLKGVKPKLSVDWYAQGGIMMKPTAFGMNGNSVMAGGEAGPEAVAPISKLQSYVADAVAAGNKNTASDVLLDKIAYKLDTIVDRIDNIELKTTWNERELSRMVNAYVR